MTLTVHFWGLLVACAVGAIAGWRAFLTLQMIEGPGREFHLPFRSAARRGARTHQPTLSLISKELRLQQLTFILFGLFAAGAVALVFAPVRPDTLYRTLITLHALYTGLICVLIGSLAIAEERQFGTMEVQLLLPIAIWKQWVVKAGVAFALAVTLGIVAPQWMRWLLQDGSGAASLDGMWRFQAVLVLVLTSTSLYVSSLCASGVRAAVMSVPAVFGLVLLVQTYQFLLGRMYRSPLHLWIGSLIPVHLRDEIFRALRWTPLLFAGAIAGIMLWLAFRNYRRGEHTVRGVVIQLAGIAAVVGVIFAVEFLGYAALTLR